MVERINCATCPLKPEGIEVADTPHPYSTPENQRPCQPCLKLKAFIDELLSGIPAVGVGIKAEDINYLDN